MGSFLSILPVVIRRFKANARLLAAVIVGAVLAAALMSTTAIYTDAIRDLGLTYAIRQLGPDQVNLRIESNSQTSQDEAYHKNRDFITQSVNQAVGPLVKTEPTAYGISGTFFPTPPGQPVSTDDARRRSNLQFLTGIEPHIRLTEGRLPGDAALVSGPPTIEVAIGAEAGRRLNLKVGDRFDLHPFWDPGVEPVKATLVGLVEPRDPNEAYWFGQTDLFSVPSLTWETLHFFVSENTFFKSVATYLPRMSSDYASFVYLDTSSINARNAESVRIRLENLRNQLMTNLTLTKMQTELPDTLGTFDEKLFFTRIPLLVLVLQIAGIVLYYLFMVSTMLVERQGAEIALLKSRGATTPQVMQIYIIEGLAILIVSLAIGPPLAALVISFLGQTPPFTDLSGGNNLSVHLGGAAFLWASAGAFLAYATLLWPAYNATKRTIVHQRAASGRPPKENAFTRYYLDLVLVGAGAALFFELNRRGTLVTERVFGGQSVDPLLLLTPAFFVLTVGILFLRLFPLVLKVLAWFVARAQGVSMLIGMWQLVRNPVHYSRLVLLLMLATAVGMFAASFGATLNRSYVDRASYQAGSQLRIDDIRRAPVTGPDSLASDLQTSLGAQSASLVLRTTGSVGLLQDQTRFEILGLDPATFSDVAYFRDDYADRSLGSLLDRLAEDAPAAPLIEIPAQARWLGVWVRPVEVPGRVTIEAEAVDEAGRYVSFTFGPEGGLELPAGWSFLAADLARPFQSVANVEFGGSSPQGNLGLVSLSLRFVQRGSAPNGAAQFDNFILSNQPPTDPALLTNRFLPDPQRTLQPFARPSVLANFDDTSAWESIPNPNQQTPEEVRAINLDTGGSAIEYRWRTAPGAASARGLRPKQDSPPLAAIASQAFLLGSGLHTGDEALAFLNNAYIPIRIIDDFRLFPTLEDPRQTPALLVNGPRLQAMANASPRGNGLYANEVWFKAGPAAAAQVQVMTAGGSLVGVVVSFDQLRDAQEKDPLVAAGWEGILFISFTAILVLSALGFLIYSYLTAQKRTLEFAVLRTMGFSKRQIATVVGFEQCFIISLGMLAGTLMGLRLGSLMIRYMGITETGDEVLPPMLLHVNWLTIGAAWLALAAAFLVTIGIVVLLYSRLQLHRVLRIGET